MMAALAMGMAAPIAAQAPFKVFMIASKASDHIAMSTVAKTKVAEIGAANGFTVDFTTDTSLITDANLEQYQVFLQMHLAPFEMSYKQRTVFQKFIDQGKGWVGVHAAGLTGDQFSSQASWTWYTDFFGGITWVVHPALQVGTALVEDRAHPVTRNLPASFSVKDEWYEWNKNPRPRVHVLIKADESSYRQVKSQGDHPMAWLNETYPRMVYIGIGHDVSDWDNPNYLILIRDAILWARSVPTSVQPRAEAQGGGKSGGKGAAGLSGASGEEKVWLKAGILHFGRPASGPGAPPDERMMDIVGRPHRT